MNKKSVLLFSAIILGIILNQSGQYAYLIKYLLMVMLFFPFLSIAIPTENEVYIGVSCVFIAMVVLSGIFYLILIPLDKDLAAIAFLVSFTPTATAAPVIISLLRKNVDYVVLSVVMTNILVAFCIPFILPYLTVNIKNISVVGVFYSTSVVVVAPLVVARFIRKASDKVADNLSSKRNIPFSIWLIVLYLATAKASSYVYDTETSWLVVLKIALTSFVICVVNFLVGKYIGGRKYSKEASQSLGQKNTMLMTWIALEFMSPIAALGPVFYLIYQNIYNSALLSIKQDGQT